MSSKTAGSFWRDTRMQEEEIVVSVKCLAYNHVKYIKQMIEGVLKQKTNFKYELVIHDDASTDGTTQIVKEYEKKYPDIIKPIYETENQYKSGSMNQRCIYPHIKGKYMAFCEGDDYWTDPNKLQIQIDYMETHPECSFTFHNADIIWENGIVKRQFLPEEGIKCFVWENKNKVFNAGELIELGFIPTASIVARTSDVINSQSFCKNPVCGDLPLRLSLSINGYAYYFNRKMSMYRTGNPVSASGIARDTTAAALKVLRGHEDILKGFNQYTNYQWNKEIEHDLKKRQLRFMMENLNHEEIKRSGLYGMLMKETTIMGKVKYYGRLRCGYMYSQIKKLRNKWKGI